MSPVRMGKIENSMRLALAFNDAFNRHNVPAMIALMSDDCVFENTSPAPDGTRYEGKEAVTQFWEEFFIASPHARIKIEDIFGMGMRCIVHWRYTRADTKGNEGHVRGVDIFKLKDGLITEKLSYVKG
jgi:steroid delta-isomerase-like uncharacterized protein